MTQRSKKKIIKENENLVEIIEIWKSTKKNGEAIQYPNKKLKLVDLIIGGRITYLAENCVAQKSYKTKEEMSQ